MAYRDQDEDRTTAEAIEQLRLDTLRPLAKLIDADAPTRKQDLVPFLTERLAREGIVRQLYDSLDEISQGAVQEALKDRKGRLDSRRFQAKYGRKPNQGTERSPTALGLLMPQGSAIPKDMRPILAKFVPEPRPLAISSDEELPETVPDPYASWSARRGETAEPIPLRQRPTATSASRELTTVLRLVESGKLKVSEKTRRPTDATVKMIAPLLVGGDFYEAEDVSEYSHDPGSDLTIRAFAWPCLLQAAGLVSVSGGKLGLSPAGRKALARPAHEVIRTAWDKWLKTNLFDEFERIDAIKGKKSARLTAAASRRAAVNGVLAELPPGRWVAVDEFFRVVQAIGEEFAVAREAWKLYLTDQYYGSFEYGSGDWLMLQGRFILAMLFEYAATLGLIDVAYIAPQGARDDYTDHWGTDELECLSRYDGLKYLRINALGAWVLGLSRHYEPEPLVIRKTWRVLPNHEVVSTEQSPDPGDALFLDRVAERTSDRVWRLDREKILAALEDGFDVGQVSEFLEARTAEPIPATVATLLADLKQRAGQLRDKGAVHMIECADAETARLLVLDPKLRSLCLPAGERNLVFRESDQAAVRAQLRKLGYVLPLRE
jgi:hypothetical protein